MSEPIDDRSRAAHESPSAGGPVLTSSLPTVPTESPADRAAGRWLVDPLYEAIVWLVVLPLLPWVLYERARRRLERNTEAGARRRRATEAAVRRLKSTLQQRGGSHL
jgi:hypothetical protein